MELDKPKFTSNSNNHLSLLLAYQIIYLFVRAEMLRFQTIDQYYFS